MVACLLIQTRPLFKLCPSDVDSPSPSSAASYNYSLVSLVTEQGLVIIPSFQETMYNETSHDTLQYSNILNTNTLTAYKSLISFLFHNCYYTYTKNRQ